MALPDERLFTPGEVAETFRVDPKTVTRWAAAGRLPRVLTPGGHSRFREHDVHALLAGHPLPERDHSGRVIERPDDATSGADL